MLLRFFHAVFPGRRVFPDLLIEQGDQIRDFFRIIRRTAVQTAVRRVIRDGGGGTVIGEKLHMNAGFPAVLFRFFDEVIRQFILYVETVSLRKRAVFGRQIPGFFLHGIRTSVRGPDPDRKPCGGVAQDQVLMIRTDQVAVSPQDSVQHRKSIFILSQQLKVFFIDK